MRNSTEWLLFSVLSVVAWIGNGEMNATDMSSYARVAGGTQPSRDRYPFFVRVDNDNRLHCGGVLIARNIVLTAAHCIVEGGSLKAYTNAYNTFSTYERMEVRSVARAIRHPSYNAATRNYDVGLLQLSSPVSFAATIPVNGDSRYPYDGDSMTVIGVGDSFSGGSSTTWLNEAQVKKVAYSTCSWSYGTDVVDSTMFCARDNGRDSCQGDSGGPILQTIGGVESVVGIVSWGRGCAQAEYPGVYARTSAIKGWIDTMLLGLTTTTTATSTMVTKPQLLSSLSIKIPTESQASNLITTGETNCDDDPQGSFNLEGVGVVNCRWLEANPDRLADSCSILSVSTMCRETCGTCSDGCNDDPSAKFPVNGVPNLSCAFLRSNPSIASTVCIPGQTPYSVCPETCNSCGQAPTNAPALPLPTPMPTPLPTPMPTPGPTITPTPELTSGQTQATNNVRSDTIPFRSNCDDGDENFSVNDQLGSESCVWLAARPEWQKTLCTPSHTAYSICEETCEVCRDACEDSSRKFDMGGSLHDCEWLSLRPKQQEEYCYPAHDAWRFCPETCESCDPNWTPPPTPAPHPREDARPMCDDSQRGRFWVNEILKSQPCVWLNSRPAWQEVLCEPGSDVAIMCPESCGACQDNCEDAREKFIVNGEIHDCLWLSLRPNVQDEVCLDLPQNRAIREICRETCNTCDF